MPCCAAKKIKKKKEGRSPQILCQGFIFPRFSSYLSGLNRKQRTTQSICQKVVFFNLLFFWKDNCFTELCCLEKGLMKELFTEVWAQIVKHPGAHNSGRESLVSGPEEVREGALLTNLARLVSMIAGHSTGAVTFTRGTC